MLKGDALKIRKNGCGTEPTALRTATPHSCTEGVTRDTGTHSPFSNAPSAVFDISHSGTSSSLRSARALSLDRKSGLASQPVSWHMFVHQDSWKSNVVARSHVVDGENLGIHMCQRLPNEPGKSEVSNEEYASDGCKFHTAFATEAPGQSEDEARSFADTGLGSP